jgi:hypothetical protein
VPANPNQQAYVIDVHREEDSAQFHAETYGRYPVVGWHIRRDDGTGATVASPILPVWVKDSATVIVQCVPDAPCRTGAMSEMIYLRQSIAHQMITHPALRCPPGGLSLVRNVLAENRWHDEAESDRSTRGQLMDGDVSERKGEVS